MAYKILFAMPSCITLEDYMNLIRGQNKVICSFNCNCSFEMTQATRKRTLKCSLSCTLKRKNTLLFPNAITYCFWKLYPSLFQFTGQCCSTTALWSKLNQFSDGDLWLWYVLIHNVSIYSLRKKKKKILFHGKTPVLGFNRVKVCGRFQGTVVIFMLC